MEEIEAPRTSPANPGRPLIAIAMGDPAGIGPEVVVKALARTDLSRMCRVVVVGDLGVLREASKWAGGRLAFDGTADPSRVISEQPEIPVFHPPGLDVMPVAWGEVDSAMGEAAAICLQGAVELALDGRVSAIVSAPLNKEAFRRAGYAYRDELAFIAHLTGSPEPFTMGVVDSLCTVSVAEHIPFREIVHAVTREGVLTRIRQLDSALQRAGRAHARIGVAALNVHGGEGGLVGREEIEQIAPAIRDAQRDGIAAAGPVPADAIFPRAFAGEFDGVVCMYHDQANIARKLRPRGQGATMFMGLPFVCGTTAHGTAFDKAGRGIADARGLETAVRWTVQLSRPAAHKQPVADQGGNPH